MEFKDRVPTYPNRRKITHEGGASEYVKIEYADEPIEEGTPLNRATFLNMVPVIGTYTGNGKYVDDGGLTINVGFMPAAVLICCIDTVDNVQYYYTSSSYQWQAPVTTFLVLKGQELVTDTVAEIVNNGFTVYHTHNSRYAANRSGGASSRTYRYNYICFKDVI